jgi:predicted DCC family thiol-disulfide oxidoreductase YuxK
MSEPIVNPRGWVLYDGSCGFCRSWVVYLLNDGRQLRGAEAYRYVMQRIWWVYPLYLLSILPLLRRIFDWGYRSFADNRYHISSTCHLPAASADGAQHQADARRGSR